MKQRKRLTINIDSMPTKITEGTPDVPYRNYISDMIRRGSGISSKRAAGLACIATAIAGYFCNLQGYDVFTAAGTALLISTVVEKPNKANEPTESV